MLEYVGVYRGIVIGVYWEILGYSDWGILGYIGVYWGISGYGDMDGFHPNST